MKPDVFSKAKIGNIVLKNRIIRSATYEGASDFSGFPDEDYYSIYETIARNNVGMIITGFSFISPDGRAMQRHQSGIDSDDKIDFFRKLTGIVHSHDCPIVMQIAHTGRQTIKNVSGSIPLSSTDKASVYFRQKTSLITPVQLNIISDKFAEAALRAKESGFDGVQIHAAHGYLIHQLLLPETNQLKNKYGIDKGIGLGTRFLEEVIRKIKIKCGEDYPLLVKISGEHDLSDNFYPSKFDNLIRFLDKMPVDAIEISYGTMDYALNIFRGELNTSLLFKTNPLYKTKNVFKKWFFKSYINSVIKPKLKEFSPFYNLKYSERAKRITKKPIISVGGFRSKNELEYVISNELADFAGLSRALIAEPDFVNKIMEAESDYLSKCTNCNDCVIMCDSDNSTRCYRNKPINHQYRSISNGTQE